MPTVPELDWRAEFGLEGRSEFFNVTAVSTVSSQAHVLRRAFEELLLDGVLCQHGSPLVYFRLIDDLDACSCESLHKTFWNQGVAPILVLIDPKQVHVYSSLSQPHLTDGASKSGFVECIQRISSKLQTFLLGVESGEYFGQHRRSFDPSQRVDRTLCKHLKNARNALESVPSTRLEPHTLDALLCRLVFTCYLFDRRVIDQSYLETIGIHGAGSIRALLTLKPRSEAKEQLYALFTQLGQDFNGDLFSDDLVAEARQIKVEHINIIGDFLSGTDLASGQRGLWPYEFGIIPIETISAIYEYFLKTADKQEKKKTGSFYTPRFLAELVIDRALDGEQNLLGKCFLDPACGSGIFLVGLFHRLAQEWERCNPHARYDARLRGFTSILRTNLRGVDQSRRACLIAAFSLHLALLDQLSPPDIRRVLKKVKVLPRLVGDADTAIIRCANFFEIDPNASAAVDYVIGNPPWAKTDTIADSWSKNLPLPNKQIAAAFVWKATSHLKPSGRVCFILPHGLLFNHTDEAVKFQSRWFSTHRVDSILNLADFQRFLFEDAEVPALVVRYAKEAPTASHVLDYWVPKTDWGVTQAELISILPQDRSRISASDIRSDLESEDAPLIWKRYYWATSRDRRLLDRLSLYPRLRDIVTTRREQNSDKRWIIGHGFEPYSAKDASSGAEKFRLRFQQTAKVESRTHKFNLILFPDDYKVVDSLRLDLRRNISDTEIFKAPLVLIKEGFSERDECPQVAYSEADIAYRHGIRGIHGPAEDRNLLALLAVYLRSSLVRYYLLHTSTSFGVSRARVDVDDLMRLPFPLPHQTEHPERASAIVNEIGDDLRTAAKQGALLLGRHDSVLHTQARADILLREYFDIVADEQILIEDARTVITPSLRPTRKRATPVPTIHPVNSSEQGDYVSALCGTINQWASKRSHVHGRLFVNNRIGIGMVVLEKTKSDGSPIHLDRPYEDILLALHHLQRGVASGRGTTELIRGLKVFDRTLLYIMKPIGRRFWTQSAALNDADEIVGALLMETRKENV